ncbi:protein of unknown function [Hyphomicrobium sp. 1Nfss2.1]
MCRWPDHDDVPFVADGVQGDGAAYLPRRVALLADVIGRLDRRSKATQGSRSIAIGLATL